MLIIINSVVIGIVYPNIPGIQTIVYETQFEVYIKSYLIHCILFFFVDVELVLLSQEWDCQHLLL